MSPYFRNGSADLQEAATMVMAKIQLQKRIKKQQTIDFVDFF